MTTMKNNKDVVVVNCYEIPEAIYVETRFITQAAAKQKKNEQVFYIVNKNGQLDLTRQEDQIPPVKNCRNTLKPTTVTVSVQSKQVTPQVTTALQSQPPPMTPIQPTTAKVIPLVTALTNLNNKDLKSVASTNILGNLKTTNSLTSSTVTIPLCNTSHLKMFNMKTGVIPPKPLENSNILNISTKRTFNDQIQQTDISALNMKSIAVQCKLCEEPQDVDDWPEVVEESSPNSDSEMDMENFLKFVKDNSTKHKNSYKECLICGEICKTNKYFYGHMAIHRGPKVLCFKCGNYLDNEKLLSKHYCNKSRQTEKAFLHCPHYACGVVAISRLELYDHINEHTNNRMYTCTGCGKGFFTAQEFLRHILIRAKCYTGAKRKLFRIYGLESEKDRLCRVRVFTLHTYKKRTTLVKTFLSQRIAKRGTCKICLTSFTNASVFSRHRVKCVAKFRKRLIRKTQDKLSL